MLLLSATLSAMCIIHIIMLCALYGVACYFCCCLEFDYCMLPKESEVGFLSTFLWVTCQAPYVLLCLSIPHVSKTKHKINAAVLPYSAGSHFNCAAACTACSNPATPCSTERKHKLVARMG